MLRKIVFLLFLFLTTNNHLFCQYTFNRDTSISVFENGIALEKAWTGGINTGQFSEIDLNLDGTMDLIVFDKTGNKLTPFLNLNGTYLFAPKYRNSFPELHDWLILADYNCDGKNDIYTYSAGGMAIYENISTTNLSFNLVTNLVLSDYGSSNINIYISPADIPAIVDIDSDGDLDILTFRITGGFVEYHKNLSIELTGNCDTVAYKYTEGCWGNFYEGLNNYVLNCTNCQCPPIINNTNNTKRKHAGSTLLAIDIDNDNDKDLILGDISFNNLNLLINGGDNQNAHITSVDSLFPSNHTATIPAEMHIFPAVSYVDVTHDGTKDLLMTTNSQNNSENFESCWLYSNSGSNNNPDLNFVGKSFLQNEMLDFGAGSYPVFFDYNNDSLIDIVVGNYGYHEVSGNPISSLALLENSGTIEHPVFEVVERDWLNISNINLNIGLNIPALNLYPTFADLNGDTYKDMILGDADGKLHYFTNNGTTPATFNISQVYYNNIDVGYFATPQLIDVNRDGLIDMLIGEQDGTLNYCPNSGTHNAAIFDTIITHFGMIDVDTGFINTGFSSPLLYDNNGNYELFVGAYSGNIYHYDNIDNNLNGQFNMISNQFNQLWEGGKSSFSLTDINNDNMPDLILGNYCGGLCYFSSDSVLINTTPNFTTSAFNIYPNPTQKMLYISSVEMGKIKIIDLLGKTLISEQKITKNHTLNLSNLKQGIYIIQLTHNTIKFIKQ